jgi:hypothetical protein
MLSRQYLFATISRNSRCTVNGAAVSELPYSPDPSMPRSLVRSQAEAPTPEPLIQPPETRSANGILYTTMTAAPGPAQLGDRAFAELLYNGAYVSPLRRPWLPCSFAPLMILRRKLPVPRSNHDERRKIRAGVRTTRE